MSAYFSDPEYVARIDREALASPSPGPVLGAWQQGGMGLARGGAMAADALRMAAAVPVVAFGDDETQDAYFAATDVVIKSALDRWTPDPESTTFAGRMMGGVAEAVLPLMLGGGNPAVLMASNQTRTSRALIEQGVDASTARDVGMVDALAIGAGFMIPAFGSTLARRLAFGAASNPVLGAASVGVQSGALAEAGRPDVAESYDPFDLEARGVDALLGAAFGGISHARGAKPQLGLDMPGRTAVETIDAVFAYQGAQRWDSRSLAPGIAGKNAHDSAMRQAMEQTIRGEPVSVRAYTEFDPPITPELDGAALGRQIAEDVFLEPTKPIEQSSTAYSLKASDAETEGLSGWRPRPGHNSVVYSIVRDGKPVGFIDMSIAPDGTARIEDIVHNAGPGRVGLPGVRGLLRELRDKHPEITSLAGERVSGTRRGGQHGNAGTGVEISVPLARAAVLLKVEPPALAVVKQARTRAEAAAERYAIESRIDTVADDLLAAIAKEGGISRQAAEAAGIDPAEFKRNGWRIKKVFTAKGLSLEAMSERLAARGYPVTDLSGYGENPMLDALGRSLRGERVNAPEGLEARINEQAAERDAAQAHKPLLADHEYDGLDTPDQQRILDAIERARDAGVPVDDLEAITELGGINGYETAQIIRLLDDEAAQRGRTAGGGARAAEPGEQPRAGAKPAGDDIDLALIDQARDMIDDTATVQLIDELEARPAREALEAAEREVLEAESTYARAAEAAAGCLLG